MEKRLTADLNVVANSNLEIQLLDGDLNIIQKLDDEPNDVGGLTSAELKAKFDESGNTIKKYINETLIPAVLAEDATEESRKQAEAARVAAEQGRVTAEEGRQSNEADRVAAENARANAEISRATAESSRVSAETGRVNTESARVSAETERASAEQTRDNSEASREFAEYRRFGAEQERVTAEEGRQANETARQNAESARQTAETNRAQTETARNVWEDYDSAKNYQPGNKVYWQGSSYVCLKPCSGISPENGTYWQLVVRSGFTSDSAFGFDVVNGRLLCYYSGDNPPPFRLGDDGHLYVDLDKTYDLGKVTGGSGSGGGVDIDLGITGAKVGQIAKIRAVDASGVPTAWSPVDMPSGGGETWETINVITLSDAVNTVAINQDSGGNAIALKKVRILVVGSATANQDLFLNNSRYIRAKVVGTESSVGALSLEPFCGKMYCFAVTSNFSNYAASNQLANIFSKEITITEIKLIVNNSGTFSAGTKFTIQGVRA